MSLSRVKVWIAGEVLTASDLNSEFNNILNNAVSLISPLGGDLLVTPDATYDIGASGATRFRDLYLSRNGVIGGNLTVSGTVTGLGVGITMGTKVATTSGTSHTFTGIPSGTKEIVVTLKGVSTNGTSGLLIRLGDSGGLETSGYDTGAGNYQNYQVSTAGFLLENDGAAAATHSGCIIFRLHDAAAFEWCSTGGLIASGYNASYSSGYKNLSAELTQISLTTVSGDTFDAGSVNISYT